MTSPPSPTSVVHDPLLLLQQVASQLEVARAILIRQHTARLEAGLHLWRGWQTLALIRAGQRDPAEAVTAPPESLLEQEILSFLSPRGRKRWRSSFEQLKALDFDEPPSARQAPIPSLSSTRAQLHFLAAAHHHHRQRILIGADRFYRLKQLLVMVGSLAVLIALALLGTRVFSPMVEEVAQSRDPIAYQHQRTEVQLAEVSTPVPEGTPWNARGSTMFTRVLRIIFPAPRRIQRIHLSLDSNDVYLLQLGTGRIPIVRYILGPWDRGQGLHMYQLELSPSVQGKLFTDIWITALAGDMHFALGQIRIAP